MPVAQQYAGHSIEMLNPGVVEGQRSFKVTDLTDGSYLLGSTSSVEGQTFVRITYGNPKGGLPVENYEPLDYRLEPVVVKGFELTGVDLVINWMGKLIAGKHEAELV